jgi:Spy/CpxP family protein refolding chaperone
MKFLKNKLIIVTTVTALGMTGLIAAVGEMGHMGRHGRFGARMSAELGLTDTQKAQAKAIFQNAHQSAMPVTQQLKQERQAVQAAIQAGKSDQEIQQLAQSEGPQLSQLAAIRASAFAKFYAMLTPDQQQKLQALRQSHHGKAPAAVNPSNQ